MNNILKVILLFAVFSIMIPAASMPTVSATSGTLIITTDTKLTEDHYGNIIIDADNITLDCKGHTISSTSFGSGNGIFLKGTAVTNTGVTIKNCIVEGFQNGIKLNQANQNVLSKNEARNNVIGFEIRSSDENIIEKNKAIDNTSIGFQLYSSFDNILNKNEVEDSPGSGFVLNENSDRNILTKNKAEKNDGHGYLANTGSNFNIFEKNQAKKNGKEGFRVQTNSHDNTFEDNKSKENRNGFFNTGGALRTILIDNKADKNSYYGYFDNPSTEPSATYADNKCKNNGFGGSATGSFNLASPPLPTAGLCTPQP